MTMDKHMAAIVANAEFSRRLAEDEEAAKSEKEKLHDRISAWLLRKPSIRELRLISAALQLDAKGQEKAFKMIGEI